MSTNAKDNTFERTTRSSFAAVSVPIAVLALLGNSLIVAAYFKYRNLRDSTTAFIVNLGFTDLITSIVLLFAAITVNVAHMPQNDYFVCLGLYRIPMYLTSVSQSLILVTTFERYMGICRRENYSQVMTTRKRVCLIAIAWLLPLVNFLIPFFGYNYWEDVGCNFPQIIPKWLLLLQSSLVFFQTAIVMTLYSRILIKAREFQRRIRHAPLQGINAITVRYQRIKRSIRNGKVIGFITIMFLASSLPFNMVLFCYCIGYADVKFVIVRVTQLVGVSNIMMNPFLYAWQRKDIRNRLKQMLRCNGEMETRNEGAHLPELKRKNTTNTQNVRILSDEIRLQQLPRIEKSSYRTRNLDISKNIPCTGTGTSYVEVTEL